MSGWVSTRILLIHMSYHIKQWEDTVARKHKGWEGVTNSYDWHSIKPQQISWKAGVFVTFGGGLEHAGGWNRSFTPKCCLSPSQCFSCSSWCSLLTEKMWVNVYDISPSTMMRQTTTVHHTTGLYFNHYAEIRSMCLDECLSHSMGTALVLVKR